MARIAKSLTNTEVKQARPKEKEYNLADGKGLALRVKPNGSKLWIFNYSRPFTRKRTNISYGSYPDLSLADARIKRNDDCELLAKDIDPKEFKDEKNRKNLHANNNTLSYVASQWFEVKKTKITLNYADDIWASFELHVFSALGSRPLHKLTAPIVINVLKPIAAKGNYETVRRLCQRLNEVMVWAVNTGLIDSNQLSGIAKAFQVPNKKRMPALKPSELSELMTTLATASIRLITRSLIEWQLHTMTRPCEAAGARWEEMDIEEKLWLIPEQRMKKRRSHAVPLTLQTLALLEVMRPISGHREFLFTGSDPTKHVNEQTPNVALKRMGFKGRLVAHGMRALASTTLNEQGFDSDIIEAALAHVDSNQVRAAYNRSEYLERRKVMMAWWSEHIEKAATGDMSVARTVMALKPEG